MAGWWTSSLPVRIRVRRTGRLVLLGLAVSVLTSLPEKLTQTHGQQGHSAEIVQQPWGLAFSNAKPEAADPDPVPKEARQDIPRGILPLASIAALLFYRARSARKAAAGATLAPPKPSGAKRIEGFDSMRFFLILYIVCGHFISFAGPSVFAYKAVTQINVVVGAFFCTQWIRCCVHHLRNWAEEGQRQDSCYTTTEVHCAESVWILDSPHVRPSAILPYVRVCRQSIRWTSCSSLAFGAFRVNDCRMVSIAC